MLGAIYMGDVIHTVECNLCWNGINANWAGFAQKRYKLMESVCLFINL